MSFGSSVHAPSIPSPLAGRQAEVPTKYSAERLLRTIPNCASDVGQFRRGISHQIRGYLQAPLSDIPHGGLAEEASETFIEH